MTATICKRCNRDEARPDLFAGALICWPCHTRLTLGNQVAPGKYFRTKRLGPASVSIEDWYGRSQVPGSVFR